MQKIQKERKILLISFASALIILILIEIMNYYIALSFIEFDDQENEISYEIKQLDNLLIHLIDAETGKRGFVITGKKNFLDIYYEGRDSSYRKLDEVKRFLIKENEDHELLSRLTIDALLYFQRVIRVRENENFQKAAEIVEAGRGKALMDSIRSAIHGIQKNRMAEYQNIHTQAENTNRLANFTTVVGNIFALLLLVSIFVVLTKEIAARKKSEMEAKNYAETIRDLYDKAPIGYYSADINGVILQMNDTLSKWLYYDKDEVINKKNFADLLNDSSLPIYFKTFAELTNGKIVHDVELEIIKKDGQPLPVVWNSTSVMGEKGEFITSRSVLFNNTELKLNREKLEIINKELESFAYSTSHDLRAPLRHINGFIDLLIQRSQEKLDEQGKRYLGIIAEAAKKMGVLIDELLGFSRMSRQDMLTSKVDLNGILEEVIYQLKEFNKERRIKWKVGKLPIVYCDAAMLKIVLTNLLSNAVKFTGKREDAEIEVDSELKNGETIIHVKDNGAGFDMQYASNLFGVFQRLHRQDEFEGTGIGLATVRRIINRHGGNIWAESEIDKGAAFYFSLPIKNGDFI